MLNKNEINNIVNLLTVRHNPLNQKHKFRRLTPNDFQPTLPKLDIRHLEKLISAEIKNIFSTYRPKSVAVPLSGGVDSTLIAQLVSEVKPKTCKLYLVSMGFGHSSDEIVEARRIATDIDNNEFHSFVIPNVLRDLEHYVSLVKEPRWNVYYGYVTAFVRNQLKTNIMITGDGGDELFGGYNFRYPKYLNNYQGSLDWSFKRALAFTEASFGRDYVVDQNEMFEPKVGFSWDKIVNQFVPFFENNLDVLNQFFMADFNSKLVHDYVPTNTTFYDYYNIHGFSPMLEEKVISYACKINPSEKYNKESELGKLPLRALLVSKGLNKFMLPQKTGYGPELTHLWQVAGRHEASILSDTPQIVKQGIISRSWIDKHLHPELTDIRYINKFLQLLALEYYLKRKQH